MKEKERLMRRRKIRDVKGENRSQRKVTEKIREARKGREGKGRR